MNWRVHAAALAVHGAVAAHRCSRDLGVLPLPRTAPTDRGRSAHRVELDLRQAAVPTGEIEVKAVAPFGEIEVIVPDGISVELTGLSVFGRKKVDVRRSALIGSAPVVRVRAVTVFGSVLVRS